MAATQYSNHSALFPTQRTVRTSTREALGGDARARAMVAAGSALLGLLVFNVGWMIAGLLQAPGYSASRDAISELSALTARHAWIMLVANGFCGVALMAFAFVGLRPALLPIRGRAISAAMIAFSPLGFDELSDAFFRLNCQTADGCTQLQEIGSWHGVVHAAVGIATIVVLLAAPFVVARTLRRSHLWEDLARPSVFLGISIDLALLSAAIPHWGGGAQRLAMIATSIWIAFLAVRVLRLASVPLSSCGSLAKHRVVQARAK
jgi:hypothetical protein